VEQHDGSGWQAQAEMMYDGLGARLEMTGHAGGLSVTTRYVVDGSQVLQANAGGKVTAYLYGRGVIAEVTDGWAYALVDGTNTPRQTVDGDGKVRLTASYTPWGDILEVHGAESSAFTLGYFGGMMDEATGLLYVGSGQYYDPKTGRFLNREAQQNQGNPYVPWGDPAGALVAPLALLSLAFGRKKTGGGKWRGLAVVLVLGASVMMGLTACNAPAPAPTATVTPAPLPPPRLTINRTITVQGINPSSTNTPAQTPSIICTEVLATTPMLTSAPRSTNTPIPTLTDDEYRIEYLIDFTKDDEFKKIIEYEEEALTLARLAIAESTQGNIKEMEYIMWTVKIRAAIGFPNYISGTYEGKPLEPVGIKEVILQPGQYSPIDAVYSSPIDAVTGLENSNLRRAFNPNNNDLPLLQDAYIMAKNIILQNISKAPQEVRGYESFAAPIGRPSTPPSWCVWGDAISDSSRSASYLADGNTAFQDCILADNYWLWQGR